MLKDKHLTLHIGMPKTGTSAIQRYLFVNREKFSDKGLYIPETATKKASLTSAHHKLAQSLYQKDADLKVWDTLVREIEQIKVQRILVSSEAFFNCSSLGKLNYIREIFPGKISGIIYIRRPDIFIHALYMQYIRGEVSTVPFNDFIQRHTPDKFKLRIELWKKFLGDDNLIIRPYEKQQWVNNDIMDDFLEHINFEIDSLETPETNPCWVSLNPICVEILRYINEKYKDDIDKLNFIRSAINKFNISTTLKGYSFYTASQRDEIIKSFEPFCSSIAKNYLNRNNGKMFHDKPEEILHTVNQESSQLYLDFFYSILENSKIINEEIHR